MIVMWPLIVSKTVNPNILPGVCKALEKYIYIHELDAVIEAANQNIKENRSKHNKYNFIKKVGGALRLMEGEDITATNYISEAPKTKSTTQTFTVDPTTGRSSLTGTQIKDNPPDQKRDSYGDTTDEERAKYDQKQLHGEAPNIGKVDAASINTEPTWNTVTDQLGRTSAIGVKVVPFIIQNEQSLIKLMTLDRYRSSLSKDLHVQARGLMKIMHRIANKTWKATIGTFLGWTGFVDKDLEASTITQNWKNDIILQNTAFKGDMFILLNKMDLEEDFLSSAKGVKGLFKLGWTSFIVADDMNKVVNFCMNRYKGLCSMVNYGFLYSDSRSQAQVYKDIDEISSRSGPLFRMKGLKKNMITDNLAQYKLDLYSSDSLMLESTFSEIVGKIKESPSAIVSNMKALISAVKRNDMKTASSIAKKFNPSNKKIDLNNIVLELSKKSPMFKKNYTLSHAVFKNSLPGLSDESLAAGATLFSGVSCLNKDASYNIKEELKKIVTKTRNSVKTLEEDNDDFRSDMQLAFLFATITVVFAGASITAALYTLIMIAPSLAEFAAVIGYWGAIIAAIFIIFKLISMLKSGD